MYFAVLVEFLMQSPGGQAHPLGRFSEQHFASFIAQEAVIEIRARFTMPAVQCIAGSFGPFTPGVDVDVPLWLALYLRQTDMCTIKVPHFLKVEYLREVLEKESNPDERTFQPLHFHFFEISALLVSHASADIVDCVEVIRLLPQLEASRRKKIDRSIAMFEAEGVSMQMPGMRLSNLVSAELRYLRSSLCKILDLAADMERRGQPMMAAPVMVSTAATPQRPSDVSTITSSERNSAGPQQITSAMSGGRPALDGAETVVPSTQDTSAVAESTTTAPALKKRRTLRQR